MFIPSFSFARTEEIMTLLYNMFKDEKWFKDKDIPVWIDGKLTNKIVERYSQILEGDKLNLWKTVRDWSHFKYNKEYKGTEKLLTDKKCGIYIASSGFIQPKTRSCDYVKDILGYKDSLIAFIGYYGGEDSIGHQLFTTDKGKPIKIDGSTLIKKCEVIQFKGFSSHIQKDELIEYFKQINADRIILHHASSEAKEELKSCGELELMNINKTTRISYADKYHSQFVLK